MFRGAKIGQSTGSNLSTTRKEGASTMRGSKIGSNEMGNNRNRGIRNLSYLEYIRGREDGRCFHCGGPYNPSHRCLERSVKVLILAEEVRDGEYMEEMGRNKWIC